MMNGELPSLFDHLPMMAKPAPVSTENPHAALERAEPAYTITVLGEPVPKGRHRSRIVYPRGGQAFVHHYQPKDTEDYENRIKQATRREIGDMEPLDEKPIAIIVWVFLPIPCSWAQKKQAQALRDEIRPLARPDADNFLKIACDGMNGVMWRDDSLVTDMLVLKRYSDRPRLVVEVFV